MSETGRMPWLPWGIPLLLLLFPWGVETLPFTFRIGAVLVMAGAGALSWIRNQPWGASMCSAAVAAGWIGLASYPAEISLWPRPAVMGGLLAAIWIPHFFRRPPTPASARMIPVLLGVLVLLTPSARRYDVDTRHPVFLETAESLSTPEDLTQWVHTHIDRSPAPPTDTALDTLRRGRGHCGAMSNLLHKLLLARGINAVILHLKNDGSNLHTLVWIQTQDGKSFLADPQDNFFRALKPGALLHRDNPPDDWPRTWRGCTRAWVHQPGRGYVPYGE